MIRLIKPSAFLLLAIAFTFSLSACDSGGSNEEDDDDISEVDDGEAAVSIDGDPSGSFDGYAYFFDVVDEEEGEPYFGLMLNNTDSETPGQSGQFIWIARQSSRPSSGQYDFATIDEETTDLQSDQFVAVALSIVEEDNTTAYYLSHGGTLTITSSSDDRVAGSFSIEASGFQFNSETQENEEVDVTLEGTFDANPADTFVDPDWYN